MKLWRCDVCHEVIDPVEDEERSTLWLALDGTEEQLDLCQDCRPSTLVGFVNWLIPSMDDEEATDD